MCGSLNQTITLILTFTLTSLEPPKCYTLQGGIVEPPKCYTLEGSTVEPLKCCTLQGGAVEPPKCYTLQGGAVETLKCYFLNPSCFPDRSLNPNPNSSECPFYRDSFSFCF